MYYHGARYRDAKTGVWLSVDPILEMYLAGKPAGGVYNPINMNLYNYCGNNPIKYIDTDGNHFEYYAIIDDCFRGDKKNHNNLDGRVLVSTYIDGNGKTIARQNSSGSNAPLGWNNKEGTSYRNEDGTPLASVLVRQEDNLYLMEIMSTDTIAPDGRAPNRVMNYRLKPVNPDTFEVDTNSKNWKKGSVEFADNRKKNASINCSDKLKIITGYKPSGNKEGRSDEETPRTVRDWKYEENPNIPFSDPLNRMKPDTNDGGRHYDEPKSKPKNK